MSRLQKSRKDCELFQTKGDWDYRDIKLSKICDPELNPFALKNITGVIGKTPRIRWQ